MANKIKEYDRSDMAAIVSEKLGMTRAQVLAVYKATGEEMPAALAEHKRIEIFGWLVGTLKEVPGKPYNIQGKQGVSEGYLKVALKPHRPFRVKLQIATGQKVK